MQQYSSKPIWPPTHGGRVVNEGCLMSQQVLNSVLLPKSSVIRITTLNTINESIVGKASFHDEHV